MDFRTESEDEIRFDRKCGAHSLPSVQNGMLKFSSKKQNLKRLNQRSLTIRIQGKNHLDEIVWSLSVNLQLAHKGSQTIICNQQFDMNPEGLRDTLYIHMQHDAELPATHDESEGTS